MSQAAAKPVLGFIGLGVMGKAMATNLIRKGGFSLVVWNRSTDKSAELESLGASVAKTPAEVISRCDISISMLADPRAVDHVYFGPGGILETISSGKACVDMSTVDGATSSRLHEQIRSRGGRFLAAPVSGSKQPAENGQLVIMAGGDKSLFEDIMPAFNVMGKRSFFLGAVKDAAKMKLVVNMIMGSMMASLAEGINLSQEVGISPQDLLDILDLGAIANPMFRMKGPLMLKGEFTPAFPLQHQLKDLRLALEMAEESTLPLPVASAAHRLFELANVTGHGEQDFSAVNEVVKQASSLERMTGS
mmetsp:Transcript_25396/g.43889  ORF Transcript_25396/g.43889 Transcript_25396/m.43889 type:complete len:305 (+) Transcript_25396:158-1072(+)